MKLIDKYIFKQIALSTIVVLITFIVVWISPEILFKIIKRTINGDFTVATAFKLFFLEIPEILGALIPSSLMLGCIWVFDRLSRDSELTVLRSIGVNFYRLTLPVLVLSIFGMVACFTVTENMIPYSTSALKILKDSINKDYFVYLDKTDTGRPRQILIVGNYDGKNTENIKLLRFSDNVSDEAPLISTISIADKAVWTEKYLTLRNITEYEIAPDGVYKNIKHLDKINIFSPESTQKAHKLLIYSTKKAKEMNLSSLKDYLHLLKAADMKNEYNYILSKYYQRFAQPFGCILFALCGVALGFGRPREKKFLGFTIGVGLIFSYLVLLPFVEMLAQKGAVAPIIAAWIPNFIIFTAIVVMIKYKQI